MVAEVALSFVLLIGAGLLFRSFLELRRIDPGYDCRGVLTFFATRDWPLTRQDGRLALLRDIQERLRALPGVESAAAALVLPLGGGQRPNKAAVVTPRPEPASAEGADFQQVLPEYFETLRTPVLAGRTFTDDDNAPGRNAVVIDDLLAARAFPGQSSVGKRIRIPDPRTPWAQVIGVVAHQRLSTIAEPGRGTVYFSDGFWGIGVSRYWMVRTSGDPANYAAAVRSAIASVDRKIVITKMQPMQTLVDRDQAGTRLSLLLMTVFAGVAVLLAAVGIYGVLAGMVRQRTAEIGVRMALGASPGGIFRLVVVHGIRLSAIGVGIGLVAAIGLTRAMSAMLVGVRPTDPSTFAAVTGFFLLVALIASWAPASRAARLDANTALRQE
jgi:putative ABC transport system permease protein